MKSLKTAPKGSSPGPGGCTYEHLRVLLDEVGTLVLLLEAASSLPRPRSRRRSRKLWLAHVSQRSPSQMAGSGAWPPVVLCEGWWPGLWQSNSLRSLKESALRSSMHFQRELEQIASATCCVQFVTRTVGHRVECGRDRGVRSRSEVGHAATLEKDAQGQDHSPICAPLIRQFVSVTVGGMRMERCAQ